jgi:hypothetical protein
MVLWSAALNGSKSLYTFTQVNSGNLGYLAALSPTPTPTNTPTLDPNSASNIDFLVITLDQSNILNYLECAEIQFFNSKGLKLNKDTLSVTETTVFGNEFRNDDSFGITKHGNCS